MSVTIRDIARKLNLSITAVSRALDGYPDISAATREKVRQAALEMGYVPNRAVRQLRRQKRDTIGYILPVFFPQHTESFHTVF
ncbi:MAG TPA: LacI family DNA-binding transcriptional regulator, partial [Anaerolineaceae bacterium]|nr:LacI family DNA-binding transcriptional regulator [Anaerolineaceae bacterium]